MYSTQNLSDKELKEQGNRMFNLRKYEDAINCYSKAIVSNYTVNQVLFPCHSCYLFIVIANMWHF